MVHTNVRSTLQRSPLGRHAVACVLVLALVWSQSLGLWHRVVHGEPFVGEHTVAAEFAEHDPVPAPDLWNRLFAQHEHNSDCQFFDQHSHGDVLTGVAPAIAMLALPVPVLAASHALAVARWHALFQARGPPPVR